MIVILKETQRTFALTKRICVLKAIKKRFDIPWKKNYDQPRQHIKSRNITLLTQVRLVKAMVFPVVLYGCESWTVKKAEHWRIDAFELWCWRRLLKVTWTARRSNQSILKEISPEYSLEELMLKLKLQYFGYLMQRNWLIRKDPDAGKDWRQEEKGTTEDEMVEWHHWLNEPEFQQTQRDKWWAEKPGVLQSMRSQRVGPDVVTEPQQQ